MALTIGIVGGKGGLGKSTEALNLARELGGRIITNDKMSKLVYLAEENEITILEDIRFIDSDEVVIYDFGGYVDANMRDIVSRVDVVIYVTTSQKLAYAQLNEYIHDLLKLNKNAFILANRLGFKTRRIDGKMENKTECFNRELRLIEKEVGERFGLDVLPLKYSNKIDEAFEEGLSLNELLEPYASKGAWKTELTQRENIMKRILKGLN